MIMMMMMMTKIMMATTTHKANTANSANDYRKNRHAFIIILH